MGSRKGLYPLTRALSLKPELTSTSANFTQDHVASVLSVEGHSSATSNVDAICNGLRRFAMLSASCSSKNSTPPEHPDAPFTELLRRATPTLPSSVSSSTSSHSRASSQSREELAADIRRIIPPSNLPPVSERIATAPCWPRSSTLSKHSSNASTTPPRTPSPASSEVPELTPSKSDHAFDTTSTRKSFAPADEFRNLYGPLLVDETCFDFDAEDQAPDVTWTLVTKDNPFLLNNCVAKINKVWSGDEAIICHTLAEQPEPNQRKNLNAQAKRFKAKKMMADLQWQEMKKLAVSHQVQNDAKRAKKMELAEEISKALKEQDTHNVSAAEYKPSESTLLQQSIVAEIEKIKAAEDKLSKSTMGQQPAEIDSEENKTASDGSYESCSDSAATVVSEPTRDIEPPKDNSADDEDNKAEDEDNSAEEDDCAIESFTPVYRAPRRRYA